MFYKMIVIETKKAWLEAEFEKVREQMNAIEHRVYDFQWLCDTIGSFKEGVNLHRNSMRSVSSKPNELENISIGLNLIFYGPDNRDSRQY